MNQSSRGTIKEQIIRNHVVDIGKNIPNWAMETVVERSIRAYDAMLRSAFYMREWRMIELVDIVTIVTEFAIIDLSNNRLERVC